MKNFLKNYRLPRHLDTLFMLLLGIVMQMTDGSPFTIKESWLTVWDTQIPSQNFSPFIEKCIKTILSGIVVFRCATTYAYVISAMLVIFCIIKDVSPKIMLVWLLISGLKSICMTLVEALIGVYVCSAFGKIRKPCLEFFISKAVQIILAAYLWANVLNIYQDMVRRREDNTKPQSWEQYVKQTLSRRPRARSLLDESTLYKSTCLNNFEFNEVPQIILQMLRREEDMSRDSLLGQGMMLASVSNMGSYDNLKATLSVGELEFTDLHSVQVMGMDDDEVLSPPEKALRFLKLTWNDVAKAQMNKKPLDKNIHKMDAKAWKDVTNYKVSTAEAKRTRPEIVLHEIPRRNVEGPVKKREKELFLRTIELKFGFSLFSFFKEKEELSKKDEEISSVSLEDEDDNEDEEAIPLFMSNIREEVTVNRIRFNFVSKNVKGNAYEKLLREEYMGLIGPEVFDRATKLPKLTSISKAFVKDDAQNTASLPALTESSRKLKRKKNVNKGVKGKDDDQEDVGQHEKLKSSAEASSLTLNDKTDFILYETNIRSPMSSIMNIQSDAEDDQMKKIFSIDSKATQTSELDIDFPATSEVLSKKMSSEGKCDEKLQIKVNTLKESQGAKPMKNARIQGEELIRDSKCTFEKSTQQNTAPEEKKPKQNVEKCFKHKKIVIRRVGKRPKSNCSSNASRKCFKVPLCLPDDNITSENDTCANKCYNSCSTIKLGNKKILVRYPQSKYLYFFTALLQEPFIDFLNIFYGLNKNITEMSLKAKGNTENKTWKSKVLKIAATHTLEGLDSPEIFASKILKNRLLKTQKRFSKKRLSKRQAQRYKGKIEETSSRSIPHLVYDADNSETSSCPEDFFDMKMNHYRCKYVNGYGIKSLKSRNTSVCLRTSCRVSNEDLEKKCVDPASMKKRVNSPFLLNSNIAVNEKEELKPSTLDCSPTPIQENKTKLVSNTKIKSLTPSEASLCHSTENQESDESYSLYYSKVADLSSPLLDMKRFIYPDHIHYSFKHVKKKGLDVDISGGLPLHVKESLTVKKFPSMKSLPGLQNSQKRITSRPMDLSFARTDAFAEWQNNNLKQSLNQTESSQNFSKLKNQNTQTTKENIEPNAAIRNWKKEKNAVTEQYTKLANKKDFNLTPLNRKVSSIKGTHSLSDDYLLMERILEMRKIFQKSKGSADKQNEWPAEQTSSTQLHSNKGRLHSVYNPAIFLNANKTRHENKKPETQEKRTKDMFALLQREALLQSNRFFGNFQL